MIEKVLEFLSACLNYVKDDGNKVILISVIAVLAVYILYQKGVLMI